MATPTPPLPDRGKRRLDRAAFVISIVALVISGLGLIDNHVSVMPKLLLSHVGESMPLAGDPRVPIWFTITNAGKVDATITEIDATPFSTQLIKDQDECNKALKDAGKTEMPDPPHSEVLPPDHTTRLNPYITLPKACSEVPDEIGVSLAIRYHDFLLIPQTLREVRKVVREKRAASAPSSGK